MSEQVWDRVDEWVSGMLVDEDEALRAAVRDSESAGLPQIQVTPPQGKFLQILARTVGARTILEIGTLGGYSTIWLARALGPGGRLVTLELEQDHADVARANLERAGVADRAEVRVGRALDSLPALEREGFGSVDLSFIDANKEETAEYFAWAVRLSRPGGLVVVDNVVREGRVVDAQPDEASRGIIRFMEAVAAEPRCTGTALQTVGAKGYDGLALVLVS